MTPLLRSTGSTRGWRRLRALVLDRDGHRCKLPRPDGRPGECGAFATHVDHVVPRKRGGQDVPANLRAACASCNLRRGAGRAVEAVRASTGWSW